MKGSGFTSPPVDIGFSLCPLCLCGESSCVELAIIIISYQIYNFGLMSGLPPTARMV